MVSWDLVRGKGAGSVIWNERMWFGEGGMIHEGVWLGNLQVQPELMAADSVRMEVDVGGGDDTAMPLLDNFEALESKVRSG